MKTDSDLKKDVTAELAWDPAVRASHIGVAVNNGVVTLSGHLETFSEKHAATHAAQRVAGVRAVAVEIDVRLAPDHKRSDTDIAMNADQALRMNTIVPIDKVRPTVEKGWVTLKGEVDWDYQRRAAEKAVRPLVGVVGISNEIMLRAQPKADDVAHRIEAALGRQAMREARNVKVVVDGTTVRLSGKVHSWQEREAVQGVAWSAPGVRAVISDLIIG